MQFLHNNVFNVDIFALERDAGESGSDTKSAAGDLVAPLGKTEYEIVPGERFTADVVIQNKGIGHIHVPEQRDMYESWVDFTLKDSSGKVIAESGL